MMRVKSNCQSEEEQQRALLLHRLRNLALQGIDRVDLRTLRLLQSLALADGRLGTIAEGFDAAVLRDDDHPDRVSLPPGPLLVYRTRDAEPKQQMLELHVLLLAEDAAVRRAALETLERGLNRGALHATPHTQKVLVETREHVRADQPQTWIPAAVKVADACRNDLLLALQATRQCLQIQDGAEPMLRHYAEVVLRPDISSLDSLQLAVNDPEQEHEKLAVLVAEMIGAAATVEQLCSQYVAQLGFLPLAPSYSLAACVTKWLADHPEIYLWNELWAWAQTAGPVAGYHACSVFVLHPEYIPDGKLPELWEAILEVVVQSSTSPDQQNPKQTVWQLRQALVQHYALHLEARLPEHHSANLACFAWWFAEQVAGLFPQTIEAAKFYHDAWVGPARDFSAEVWKVARPAISPSRLRFLTLAVPLPWAASLLALLGENFAKLAFQAQAPEVQQQLWNAMICYAIPLVPCQLGNSAAPTFAVECQLRAGVQKWQDTLPAEQSAEMDVLLQSVMNMDNIQLASVLQRYPDLESGEQIMATAFLLREKAFASPELDDKTRQVIADPDWRRRAFNPDQPESTNLLMECLCLLQVANRQEWEVQLPHFIAELCEAVEDNQHQKLCFLYLLHASMAADTVSALRRVLRGKHRSRFVELAEEYRGHFVANMNIYPAWVAANLRKFIVSLHVR